MSEQVRLLTASDLASGEMRALMRGAVGFYRKLGFLVTPAPEDPRWPGSARYRCVLGRGPFDDAG